MKIPNPYSALEAGTVWSIGTDTEEWRLPVDHNYSDPFYNVTSYEPPENSIVTIVDVTAKIVKRGNTRPQTIVSVLALHPCGSIYATGFEAGPDHHSDVHFKKSWSKIF
jgi:hypothetical protein